MNSNIKKKIETIINVISVAFGIFIAIWLFSEIYTTQPVGSDFQQLYDVEANYIEGDLDYLYDLDDATITISEDKIIVRIENEKCELFTYFDKDFNYLKTKTASTVDSGFEMVIACGAMGILLGFFACLALWIVYGIIFAIVKIIIFIVKAVKSALEENKKKNPPSGDIDH